MARRSPGRLRRGAALLGAVLSTCLLAGQAAADKAEQRLERFKEQTVMITVTHRDRSVVHGAGVVLCQEFGRAYVATAYQLLAAEMAGGRRVLRRPARTEIRFFDDSLPSFVDQRADPPAPGAAGPRRGVTLYKHGEFHGPSETFYEDDPDLSDNAIGNDTVSSVRVDPGCEAVLFEHSEYRGRSTTLDYEAERLWFTEVGRDEISSLKVSCRAIDEKGLTFHQAPEAGLVLLSFPAPELKWTAASRRGIFESGSSSFTRKQPIVSAVGYRDSSRESWAHRSGKLLPGGGRLLRHSVPIEQGFVGGPLFNKRSLIGVNLRMAAGEIGTATGETYSEALSVKQILPAIGKWLPTRCQKWIRFRVDLFLPPPTDSPLSLLVAQADELKVKNRMSFSEELRFGSYRVTRVQRRSIETGSRWQQAYNFSFAESKESTWEGKCILGEDTENAKAELDWAFRLELSVSTSLICEFKKSGGAVNGRIVMREHAGSDPSAQVAGAESTLEISIVDAQEDSAEKPLPDDAPAAYMFFIADQAIGAVETAADGTVWLHPSAVGETRSAFLVASAAMLLNPDFN